MVKFVTSTFIQNAQLRSWYIPGIKQKVYCDSCSQLIRNRAYKQKNKQPKPIIKAIIKKPVRKSKIKIVETSQKASSSSKKPGNVSLAAISKENNPEQIQQPSSAVSSSSTGVSDAPAEWSSGSVIEIEEAAHCPVSEVFKKLSASKIALNFENDCAWDQNLTEHAILTLESLARGDSMDCREGGEFRLKH